MARVIQPIFQNLPTGMVQVQVLVAIFYCRPNTSVASFNTQLRAFAKKVKSPDNKDSHIIQPLSDVHYDTKPVITAAKQSVRS